MGRAFWALCRTPSHQSTLEVGTAVWPGPAAERTHWRLHRLLADGVCPSTRAACRAHACWSFSSRAVCGRPGRVVSLCVWALRDLALGMPSVLGSLRCVARVCTPSLYARSVDAAFRLLVDLRPLGARGFGGSPRERLHRVLCIHCAVGSVVTGRLLGGHTVLHSVSLERARVAKRIPHLLCLVWDAPLMLLVALVCAGTAHVCVG